MSAHVGIEIAPGSVRAVSLDGWRRTRSRVIEVEWEPEHVAEAVAALRIHLRRARRIAVAVDLSFLYAKQVKLPPVTAAEKVRILSLEPERFFPVRAEDLVLSVRDADNLVFATRETWLAEWLAALEAVGPVDLVEPAPVALARALSKGRLGTATILAHGHEEDGIGIVELRGGRVVRVQKVHGDASELAQAVSNGGALPAVAYVWTLNGGRAGPPSTPDPLAAVPPTTKLEALPNVSGIAPPFLAAYGAALGIGRSLQEALVPPELGRRIARRRLRDVGGAAAMCVAALLFALAALDFSRNRVVREVDSRISALQDRAADALALQRQAQALEREARAVARIEAERSDPVRVLFAVSERLPRDAHIRSMRGSGNDWQIEGQARAAARLVPLLDADPRLEDVRFLAATRRIHRGNETNESFSIAFRYSPAP